MSQAFPPLSEPPVPPEALPAKRPSRLWILDLLLILVVLVGGYFRFVGINWGEYTYMHPDERFLVWVTNDIAPVKNLGEFFNTAASTLNPNNRGHGFYVYGTLPIFLGRYLADALAGPEAGWNQILDIGRPLSALADLLVVVLVYLAAARLYNRRIGLLASAFYALAVLPIQLSHYYKEDTLANLFTFLAIYFAVRVMTIDERRKTDDGRRTTDDGGSSVVYRPSSMVTLSIGFGLALGCAVASKLNAAPVAAMLPAAFLLRGSQRPRHEWEREAIHAFGYVMLAAAVSLLVFRVLQPYAFSGPGFFGFRPNPQWVANIREQRLQAAGDVDFPPALQWARRPAWFAGENLVIWGLGLPLGLLAWTGFLWMGWRMLRDALKHQGGWQRHTLLWGWTAFYFVWQSAAFNPTMRYLLPIYPTLAIFAAWAVVTLYDDRRQTTDDRWSSAVHRPSSIVLGSFVLLATLLWAIAFTGIYRRPFTRVAASRWVYQNVPGPINLRIDTGSEVYNEPLPFPTGGLIRPDLPYLTSFEARADGKLSEIVLGHATQRVAAAEPAQLGVSITMEPDGSQPLASGLLVADPAVAVTPGGADFQIVLNNPVDLLQGVTYTLVLEAPKEGQVVDVCGPLVLHIQSPGSPLDQTLDTPSQCILRAGKPTLLTFSPQAPGLLAGLTAGRVVNLEAAPPPQELAVSITRPGEQQILSSGRATVTFDPQGDPRGAGYTIKLDTPLEVSHGEVYQLALTSDGGNGSLALSGSAPAMESSWDDGIPLRIDGYDAYGGIYQGDLNFELYNDDSPDKLQRFLNILDRADYIFITSNRQWATTTRVPERYPLTTEYYRRLMGCPPDKSVVWCYGVAQEGTFQGDLGYELVQVFDSSPRLGPLVFNDQFAEEALTVYDHPKVFIFRKSPGYDPSRTAAILKSVDLSQVVHVTPRKAESYPANLMLPAARFTQQRMGGTWSKLFNTQALQNISQPVAVLFWYLSLFLLGLLVYPLVRMALPGLADRGYPLARISGLLLLSYLVWLAGSLQIPATRPTIAAALALLAVVGLLLAYQQRRALAAELRQRGGYFLMIEALFLAFFLFDLLIRWGNPDLWHPAHGGEKPMDFSYFNAVLKSTTFPPYDPWFAGGYLNYYYYGFMLVGVLVKLLGIVPSVAYNLILPTIFASIALGAFSIGWNLMEGRQTTDDRRQKKEDERRMTNDQIGSSSVLRPSSSVVHRQSSVVSRSSFLVGISAALGMAVLGNLGTVRMIWRGYQMVTAPGGVIQDAGLVTRWVWAFQGFLKVMGGAALPYGLGDWYWIPSRAIPAPGDVEPITEFPMFTILYGDPHAHLFALPITLLVLAFALSIILCRGRWESRLGGVFGFFLGALAVGAVRPTNAPDAFLYIPLAALAVGYAYMSGVFWLKSTSPAARLRLPDIFTGLPEGLWSFLAAMIVAGGVFIATGFLLRITSQGDQPGDLAQTFLGLFTQILVALIAVGAGFLAWRLLRPRTHLAVAFLTAVLAAGLLFGLSRLLFLPFSRWYALGYNKYTLWTGTHTPTSSYLVHWGLFLFLIVSWMTWETRDWMASTPVSSLRKLEPFRGLLITLAVALLVAVAGLTFMFGVSIAWLVLPLAAWAAVLLLRPGQPDVKRFVLFLIGTGLTLTLVVEVVVFIGDVGRMNTVFKLYLEVWTLFAICAAASLGWILEDIELWWPRWRVSWEAVLVVLVFSTALYPLMAGMAKVKNRMALDAPHTLDGMAYMQYAQYADEWGTMDLSQDYRAIRWMQENVKGSPVIVEANLRNLYRWGSRFSVYTGLPGVVGWEWHQQQQRALLPGSVVSNRIAEVDNFYSTTDLAAARDFLRKYDVSYIVLGQQERGHYPGPGLDKFAAANGSLWRRVYQDGQTEIYEVIRDQ